MRQGLSWVDSEQRLEKGIPGGRSEALDSKMCRKLEAWAIRRLVAWLDSSLKKVENKIGKGG